MKAQSTDERAETEKPRASSPRKGAITEELPAVGEPDVEESEDLWKEIPTVSNRTGLSSSAGGGDTSTPAGPPEGAGTYRLLRPTISDVLENPTAAKDDALSPKRTVVGSARKPKP
ncbi:MAG: hypothetical protein JXP73_03800 [Deltaproteobacteria bacterium]|nr:hypothetical protein [Deltaproteobacteria bacterium]